MDLPGIAPCFDPEGCLPADQAQLPGADQLSGALDLTSRLSIRKGMTLPI